MSNPPPLQYQPLPRFLDLYEALNAERGWGHAASPLRFSAIAALTCDGDARTVANRIRTTADEIKEQAGWFGQLRSSLRYVVASLLICHGDTPRAFNAEIERVREFFRALKLRRGGIYETMAILILRIQHRGSPIPKDDIARFQAIYEELKRYHWWLTGPDDFPACAVLVGQREGAHEIGHRIEQIYQELRGYRFSTGDPLQTAANLLYLAEASPSVVAHRFADLSGRFKEAGIAMWQSDYDELAILSFLDHPVHDTVDRVVAHREVMTGLKPKPDRSTTFNLACGITFLELVQHCEDTKSITDVKAMLDIQAVINAQQAAAASAASSASSAS